MPLATVATPAYGDPSGKCCPDGAERSAKIECLDQHLNRVKKPKRPCVSSEGTPAEPVPGKASGSSNGQYRNPTIWAAHHHLNPSLRPLSRSEEHMQSKPKQSRRVPTVVSVGTSEALAGRASAVKTPAAVAYDGAKSAT
ncbi:hypothetical protein PG993_008885 [Apiospora rasikravindrae]|uniref:Uncharacterized protein n=1 Tax=Apiospora rasikravindrae TaxID=990691 RepID=A0ABR1SPL1_9PEZI